MRYSYAARDGCFMVHKSRFYFVFFPFTMGHESCLIKTEDSKHFMARP